MPYVETRLGLLSHIFSLVSVYYGNFKHDTDKLWKRYEKTKHSFTNKLCGERQYPRFLMIERIILQCKQWSLNHFQILSEIDKQIVLKLFELSINRYGEVRSNAQGYLFSMLKRYLFSYQVILDRILELLKSTEETDHDTIKGCLYVLLGNSSFFMPTKHSWPMIEKLWPSLAQVTVKKPTTQRLIDCILETIGGLYDTQAIIEDTNEESTKAAEKIWRPMFREELKRRDEIRQERNDSNIRAYTNLMENLSSLLAGDQLTWRQQEMAMSFMEILLQRRVPLPLSCVKIMIDLLVHDNVELRKIAEESVTALCRLQKPPRTYVEKPIEAIINMKPNGIHPGDRDDNLWVTYNNYQPKSQQEWENMCFLDKAFWGYYSWPKLIKYPVNQRERYKKTNLPKHVSILYERFSDKNFIKQFIHFMVLDEDEGQVNFDIRRFQMFKGIFRNFGLEFVDNFFECLYALIHNNDKTKQEGSHRVAAEITAGIIRGSKYWTVNMLDELWNKLTPFLNEVFSNLSPETLTYWGTCFKLGMEDEDPRRMYKPIEYILSLTTEQTLANTFNETSRWYLTQTISNFEWRVPTVWTTINKHATELLDHPFKAVRERIAKTISTSITFDITLPNGQSTRHPDVNKFIDSLRERLEQAIEIYERTPLANVTGQVVEIDFEARKALNFIETAIQLLTHMFSRSLQPVKESIIRIFPLV
ncbi:unnamed protein product [Didymodactylos carnosus]|uniref:Proteasome activator complex subunit 4-like HEAT repeat-like domain-containing protein n=1 Tax=Didymodactylos carnosus TaxID=1234261 RepID=A0A815TND2_9BILA|nr:unnamed protein product [Didymodactylos carnosus]CAF4369076.1 unnamed protein product [Didymodactylos carnosus]